MQGALSAVIIRSPFRRGAIRSIAAPGLPEPYRLLKAEDVPGANALRLGSRSMPILAELRVSYEGEPLALLVGPDPLKAKELARSVVIDISEEDPFLGSEKFSSDQIEARKGIERGKPRDFLGRSANGVFEGKYKLSARKPFMSVGMGAAVTIQGKKLVAMCPSPWPFHARATIAEFLGIDEDDIVVIATSRPRSEEGPLLEHSRVAALCAFAALAMKSSVRIDMSASDSRRWCPREAGMTCRIKTSHLDSGRMVAADIQLIVDVGAYGIFAEEFAERAFAAALGPYGCENFRVEVFCVSTNDLPVDSVADTCLAGAQYFIDTHLARYARSVDLDPIELRTASIMTGNGSMIQTGEVPTRLRENLAALDRASGFSRKYSSFSLIAKSEHRGLLEPRRGIGIAIASAIEGFLSGSAVSESSYSVDIELDMNSSLSLISGIDAEASGVADHWRRLASDILGIDADEIRIPLPSTASAPDTGPSCYARPHGIITDAIEKGLALVQKQRFRKPLPIRVSIPLAPKKHTQKAGSRKSWIQCVIETESDLSQHYPSIRGCWLSIEAEKDVRHSSPQLEAASFHALASAMLDPKSGCPGPWLRMPFRASINGGSFDPWQLVHAAIPSAYSQSLSLAFNTEITSLPASHEDSIGDKP